MLSKYDQELKDLKDVMYVMELKYSEREKSAQQEFQGDVDELKNKVRPWDVTTCYATDPNILSS